ncbi:UNVERIFIED_CONTAM: hypothetical protein K2H54_057119 [Gekko kuhli]
MEACCPGGSQAFATKSTRKSLYVCKWLIEQVYCQIISLHFQKELFLEKNSTVMESIIPGCHCVAIGDGSD